MPIRTAAVDGYVHGLRPERDPVLAEMERLAARDRVPIVEWETGRLLATLVRALAPARVLEVGTAIGVSALHMARELPPAGRIVTLERDEERIEQARGFFARAGVDERIEVLAGDALETLRTLDGPFDLVFVDATKTETLEYVRALEGRLAPRAVLVVDNLLMGGEVAGGDGRWGAESLASAREAASTLMASEEWLGSVLPVGDGVGLFARR